MSSAQAPSPTILTPQHIETFLRDGVVVVEGVLTSSQLEAARRGLQSSLARHGVDTDDLEATGASLVHLSSTHGSGGVLDIVYEPWKLEVALNERLFQVTTELWNAGFCHDGERREDVEEPDLFRWHPYGRFDCSRGYVYMDRVGFRIPTALAERLGQELQQANPHRQSKKKKAFPIQRSLTPHLDCCPETFFSPDKTKWRPIQCLVSLTDTLEANTGGFEAAKGFHRDFDHWSRHRPPSRISRPLDHGRRTTTTVPAPCVGEYTHIRPVEDADVLARMEPIPVRAGSAVLWDNRIPHANAYRHQGRIPRCVVYCSFLPDVAVNREFAAQQLGKFRQGLAPVDTKWMDESICQLGGDRPTEDLEEWMLTLSPLQRCLLGLDAWPND